MLINPHNPMGQVYTAEQISEFLIWAKRYSAYIIFLRHILFSTNCMIALGLPNIIIIFKIIISIAVVVIMFTLFLYTAHDNGTDDLVCYCCPALFSLHSRPT